MTDGIQIGRRWIVAAVGMVLTALAAPEPALAHQTHFTTGRVLISGADIRYHLIVSAHDLALVLDIPTDLRTPIPMERFAARLDLLREYLDETLMVSGDGAACPRTGLVVDYSRLPEDIILEIDHACPTAPRRLRIAYRLFFAVDLGHRAIGTVDDGRTRTPYLLDRNASDIVIDRTAGELSATFARTLLLGFEHILIGFDHVLFVVALLLGGGRLWALVTMVTAFTVAHSLTLALAWFGLVDLPARLVESLIAASIVYVAAENILGRGLGHRWLLAFGFGLVHGLGFYGVLNELDLDPQHTAVTLLAFNLGVELGQLAIVAALFPLLAWAARRRWYRQAAVASSLAILAIAAVWLLERAGLA